MRLWPWSNTGREAKSSTWETFRAYFAEMGLATSGARVNQTTALQVTTAFACARLIAEGLAQGQRWTEARARELADAVLEILYGSGVRVSELCSLDVRDVRSGRAGSVPDAITVWGKGSKERVVPLSAPAVDALRGWLAMALLEHGPLGLAWLKPEALFGLSGLDGLSHAMLWSLVANIGLYVAVSLARSTLQETVDVVSSPLRTLSL